MKCMLNITWRCNLDNCPYCWVRREISDRQNAPEQPWEEWLAALMLEPRINHIDFVGGEPLIYPWFPLMVKSLALQGKNWALTTNLVSIRYLELLPRLPGCRAITCSWHPENKAITFDAFVYRANALAGEYPVSINILENASRALEWADRLRNIGFTVNVSPYEDISLAGPSNPPRVLECNAGSSHCVLDPEGNVYPCLSLLRRPDRKDFKLGNIFHGDVRWPDERYRCTSYCYDYDVLYSRHSCFDMWGLDIKEV